MAKKRSFKNGDIHIEGDHSKPAIYILHGFGSNPKQAFLWGEYFEDRNYEVFIRRARGHDNKLGQKYHWIQTIQDHRKFIDTKIKRETIVLGHSMGGTESISLAKSPYVKQVYAISALNSDEPFEEKDKQRLMKRLGYNEKIARKYIEPALPENVSLTKKQKEKLFLIHSKGDHYVSYEEFKKNKKQFDIPKARTKTVKNFRHSLTPNDFRVKHYINRNIQKVKPKKKPKTKNK